jgi:hypothetical protein
VIVISLVVQGFTLEPLVRRTGIALGPAIGAREDTTAGCITPGYITPGYTAPPARVTGGAGGRPAPSGVARQASAGRPGPRGEARQGPSFALDRTVLLLDVLPHDAQRRAAEHRAKYDPDHSR